MLIHNAEIVDGVNPARRGWVLTSGPLIESIGEGEPPREVMARSGETVDAAGRMLLPGAIDCHVHFREPGLTAKATIASESAAAVAGGVTSYIDMPNTVPPTVTLDAWADKMRRAEATSLANYAFMIGATADNLDQLQRADYTRVAAVKVFMGSSTGGMLLRGTDALAAVFADQPGRVVVHAEDQDIIDANMARHAPLRHPEDMRWHSRLRDNRACAAATERALTLAARYGTRLHVAHVTTREETAMFDPSPSPAGKRITAEVSPHHLLWTADDYPRLGSRIKMNPAVKSAADRAALRRGVTEGRLDIIATDHAPHRPEDKSGDVLHAASGAPMVQFSLPAMIDLFGPDEAVRRMCVAPAALYGIEGRGRLVPGAYADMVLVERLAEPHVVADSDVLSLCGWTPMVGSPLSHRVMRTWVNGGCGPMPLRFNP